MNAMLRTTLIGTLAVSALWGCDRNDSTAPDVTDAPPLPPVSSLRFDTSFFENQPRASQDERQTAFHWGQAVVHATYVNLLVAEALYTPWLAFGLAIHTVPSPQEDGSYLWVYTWVDEANDHEVQIRLRGEVVNAHVEWELRVSDDSAEPAMSNFLWFFGESSLDGTDGFWVFNDRNLLAMEMEVARIDWMHVSETDESLVFTNTNPASEDNGDALTYRVDGTNASMEFEDADQPAVVWLIEWDRLSHVGSIQVPSYNDGDRACWDENLQDTECEAPPAL